MREVRQLPFGANTFRDICKKFYVHASISRVINRADTPLFSRAEVKMGSEGLNGPSYSTIGIHEPDFLALLLNYHFANICGSLQLQICEYLERRPRFNGHVFSTQQTDVWHPVWMHRSYRTAGFKSNCKC
jgi:hypothetical protein